MASYYQILANFDPIFMAFEIWAKFCQKITKSPPKIFFLAKLASNLGPIGSFIK